MIVKRIILLLLVIILCVTILTSCGALLANATNTVSYKTITGKRGDVSILHGNEKIVFEDVKITYSDSDTMAVMFQTDKNDYYYQDGFIFKY